MYRMRRGRKKPMDTRDAPGAGGRMAGYLPPARMKESAGRISRGDEGM
jgi:hypothetical protein